jgi:hypothetical protein
MIRLRTLVCLAKEKVPSAKSLEFKSRRLLSQRPPLSEGDFANTEERSHDAEIVEVAVSANIMCSATIATSAFKPVVSHLLSKVYVPRQLPPWARPATKPK